MWKFRIIRRRARRASSVTKHYLENKETARELVLARLQHFAQHYGLKWKRVAIRNQRRCWGSCSSLKNLNFNYKIILLPPHLRDYIIVHELCHLAHLNHGREFWNLVAEQMPDFETHVNELRKIDKGGNSIPYLLTIQAEYLSGVRAAPASVREVPTSIEDWCGSCERNMVCNCEKLNQVDN